MNWLNKLERKIGRHYIPDLMKYLCFAMLGVFILEYLPLARSAWYLLYFNRDLILRGEIWRLITFIFLPPNSSIIWILFSLYFYYFLGTALESRWGSRKFNLYILIGWLCNVICGFLTGYAVNSFLYTTLLLAFAVLYPDMEILLFFFLPVKMRWIGGAWAVYLFYQLIVSPFAYEVSLLFSLLPFLLFFGKQAYLQGRMDIRRLIRWINLHR